MRLIAYVVHGEIQIVLVTLHGANLTENAVKIVSNGKSDQTYLKYALLSDDAHRQMKVLAGGVTSFNISARTSRRIVS